DSVQKYLNLTSYYGQQVEMDNQARVVLPQILRNSARLDAEVAVMGKINYLEVHNLAQFEEGLPSNVMTVEDRKAVAAILSRRN
ncbi:MAG: division/cell wall cluster transcriptional repressor MraZ, partial [Acidobacteriota bacterium]